MRFVLDHLLAITFVGLFLLAVLLLAAVIEAWLNAGQACIECGCTERRACPGGCWWILHEPPLCSSCGTDDDAGVFLNRTGLRVGAVRSTRAPGARTIDRKEERRDSSGDQRRSPAEGSTR